MKLLNWFLFLNQPSLKSILKFAIKHHACETQPNKFRGFIQSGDELSAWQTVQGNIYWLKAKGLKINPQFLWKKSGGLGKTWYSNGNLCEQYTYNSKGKREGLYQSWYDNGQLWEQYTYNSKGRQEGLYQRWHQDGELDI
jgi:hypothetical protein